MSSISKIEEMRLLALCMATDNRRAFSRLVEAYQEPLRNFLFNLTGHDACLADDLAQETFIKAWLNVRSFRGLAGFKTWLYRIAVNEFVSYSRRAAARTQKMDIDDVTLGNADSPEQQIDAEHDAKVLLSMLNEKERIVCLLFYIEDQPIKKIATITGMPEGSVKSYLKRARDRMGQFARQSEPQIQQQTS